MKSRKHVVGLAVLAALAATPGAVVAQPPYAYTVSGQVEEEGTPAGAAATRSPTG